MYSQYINLVVIHVNVQVSLVPRSEKNTLVTAHATKVEPGYLVELAKEVTLSG